MMMPASKTFQAQLERIDSPLKWVMVRVPFDAGKAMKLLHKAGVGTRPFFWPMHRQPVFEKMGLLQNADCPVAERLGARGFYVPAGLAITNEEIKRSAAALRQIIP